MLCVILWSQNHAIYKLICQHYFWLCFEVPSKPCGFPLNCPHCWLGLKFLTVHAVKLTTFNRSVLAPDFALNWNNQYHLCSHTYHLCSLPIINPSFRCKICWLSTIKAIVETTVVPIWKCYDELTCFLSDLRMKTAISKISNGVNLGLQFRKVDYLPQNPCQSFLMCLLY